MWPFKRKPETRNYTSMMMDARMAAITGKRGIGDLTGTVQSCIGLWEAGLSIADVSGTNILNRSTLALMARELGLRGEAVYHIGSGAFACQWDVSTQDGKPTAYRLTMADIKGGRNVTALADEVIHVRIGRNVETPWSGTAPLNRASLTAGLLDVLERTLTDVYSDAPIGSLVVPFPESSETEHDKLARSFRGQRGRVLLRESVATTAAGGPTPQTDWRPSDLSPDLSRSMTAESLSAAHHAILSCYGVLPALLDSNAAGPSIREGQRHLMQFMLQPIAGVIAEEASLKLATTVSLDTMRPSQAFDAGGRARALSGVIKGMAEAKEAGLSDEQMAAAMKFAGIDQ